MRSLDLPEGPAEGHTPYHVVRGACPQSPTCCLRCWSQGNLLCGHPDIQFWEAPHPLGLSILADSMSR